MFKATEIKVPGKVEYIQARSYGKRNPEFQGRKDLLNDMGHVLLPQCGEQAFDNRLLKSFIICGTPGMGKTQLASQFFHSHEGDYDVRLWVQANSKESLFLAFNQIAVKLGIHIKDSSQDMPLQNQQLVLDWLRDPIQNSTKRVKERLSWLLVFDNADEPNVLPEFWPQHAPGSVIITTRDRTLKDGGEYGEFGTCLPPLPTSDAVGLLKSRLNRSLWESEPNNVLDELVQRLGCWPLSIVQMSGNMDRLHQTPSRFLDIYRDERNRTKYFEQAPGLRHGYSLPMSSIWPLREPELPAARLLSIISLLMPETVPEVILIQDPSKARLRGYPLARTEYDWAVLELVESSTVSRMSSSMDILDSEITIHSFIQEVVRSHLLKDEKRFVETFNAVVRLLLTIWPCETLPLYGYAEPNSFKDWRHRDRLAPHLGHSRRMFGLLSAVTRPECVTEEFLTIMSEIAW